jgi:hypothetical protein
MSQLQITGEAKIRTLTGALTATAGVVTSVPLGTANGVATLGGDGKVPAAQLPTMGSSYKGTWNASTNTPTIADGVGTAGDYYLVSTGGTWNGIVFLAGNTVIYSGTVWQKAGGGSGTVTSVGLAAPSAFSVSGSPVTSTGTLTLAGAGSATDYIKGDGTLGVFGSSAISAVSGTYLALAGGTLTGPLSGTSATFSGNVGVGGSITTIAGFTSLTIDNSSNGSFLDLNNSGTNNLRFLTLSSVDQRILATGNLTFYTASNQRMQIASGGNVLIGTTTDNGAKLQVNGSATFSSSVQSTDLRFTANGYLTYDTNAVGTNTMQIRSGYAGAVLSFNGVGAASFLSSVTTGAALRISGGSTFTQGEIEFTNTASAGQLGIFTNQLTTSTLFFDHRGTGNTGNFLFRNGTGGGNTLMAITGNGSVGIGTNSPDSKLVVSGSGQITTKVISSNNQANIFLQGTFGQFENLAGELYITNNASSSPIIFRAGSASERMRITSDGSLLIGTTTDVGSGYKLQVNGSISMAYANFFNFKGSSGAGDVLVDNSGSTLRVTGAVQLSNAVTFNSTALVLGLLTNYNVYNAQTSSYTLVLSDASKIIEMNVGSANTVTIPTNASVPFPIGTEITVMQYGGGVTSIAVASGVTIVSKDNAYTIANRYTGVTLVKRATNEWYIIGNIVV